MAGSFGEAELVEVLERAQELGFLGDLPIRDVIEHARIVVRALEPVSGTVVDLGSGGGVPGLVVASDRPDLRLILVDRRRKRTDVLERVVRRHGLVDRVEVVADDVEVLIDEVTNGARAGFDAAIARGFGPPEETLRVMSAVLAPAGRAVVTEPPVGDRWDPELVRSLRFTRVPSERAVAVFVRDADAG